MAVFRVKVLKIPLMIVPRRNYDFVTMTVRKLYSTQPQSQEMENEAKAPQKAPGFNKEFKGMKAEFPCVTRLIEQQSEDRVLTAAYGEEIKGFQLYSYSKNFNFHYGGILPEVKIAYETWGTLNKAKDNAIILHGGLSASSHAKSHPLNTSPGWWEKFIGPGCALDTDKFYIICTNNLGGCFGSSGPASINALTGKEYATTFPLLAVSDMVKAIFLLLNHLEIDKVHASIGSSLGGMQSLLAGALYPDRVKSVVSISSGGYAHPSAIALRYIQRRILMSDPNWNNGNYYGKKFPVMGMQHAREVGTITYRSGPEWELRFNRKRRNPDETPSFCPDYEIEHYLARQGEKFCKSNFDPNSWLYISKAMDMFDMSIGFSSLSESLSRIKCPILVLGVKSDMLFPITQQQELSQILEKSGNKYVKFYEINSLYGHDTFLLDVNNVGAAVKGHLESL